MEMEMSEGVSECERLVIELVRNLFKQENFFFFSYPGGKVTRPLNFPTSSSSSSDDRMTISQFTIGYNLIINQPTTFYNYLIILKSHLMMMTK